MILSDEDISIIKRTWETPRKALAETGVVILTDYFETYPDHMKKFEKFRDIPLEELKKTDKFKNHALKIMETFDKCVSALSTSNPEATIVEVWQEMGGIHFRKKIPLPYFEDLKGVIFKNLGAVCKMNDRDAEAWGKFFDTAYSILFSKINELEAETKK